MQTKNLIGEVKDLDGSGIVTFYFSAFGNKDSDGDITHPGAFAKTIKENFKRIRHFKNHRWDQLVGVPIEIKEDDFGAMARSQLIMGTQFGKDTYEEYKAKGITEHSFMYDVIKYDVDNEDDKENRVRNLRELKLWEVSSLTSWGANQSTPVIDLKSMNPVELTNYLDTLTKLQKGDFTDEYFGKLEKKLNEIYSHIKSLIEPPAGTPEPMDWVKYLQTNLKIK